MIWLWAKVEVKTFQGKMSLKSEGTDSVMKPFWVVQH